MKAAELYTHLKQAFGPDLKSSDIDRGQAFFWKEKKVGPTSTRVLRVHENAAGSITEIKLSVTSLRTRVETTLPLPTTLDEVTAHLQREIDLLEK